jgi:periplasmic divalent cation tolerance protein
VGRVVDNPGAVVVLVSCDSVETASRIARDLVDQRLAACVTRIPGAVSVYRWEGGVEEAEEVLLLAKTSITLAGPLAERVASLHPYKVPEIITLPLVSGWSPYVDWLLGELRGGGEEASNP